MTEQSLTETQFKNYARKGFRRIPVYRLLPVGRLTPFGVFRRLTAAGTGPSYILESMRGFVDETTATSIIGLPTDTAVEVADARLRVLRGGREVEALDAQDPYAALRQYCSRFRAPRDLQIAGDRLPFHGGLVGYFAYDLLRYVEPRLARTAPRAHPLGTPDIQLLQSDEFVVCRQLDDQQYMMIPVVCVDPETMGDDAWQQAQERLQEIEELLCSAAAASAEDADDCQLNEAERAVCDDGLIEIEGASNLSRQDYMEAVERIREYILAGDVMQVVPSRRVQVPLSEGGGSAPVSPLQLYSAMRALNPPAYRRYMYYIDFGQFQLAGMSPETLVQLCGDEIVTCPIAGTRRRGRSDREDRNMAAELLADPKEIAEHLMLIDLGRNDVGKVSAVGSVRVPDNMKMKVERYSHVMHIVSKVTGRLAPGLDALDVLRSILPAGTLSGAPKIRAMEIIDEFEPVRRSIYGGAVGFLSWDGDMNTAVAIRTAVIRNGEMSAQVGGGIVADSIPELEWKETENKARGMLRALALARHRAAQEVAA